MPPSKKKKLPKKMTKAALKKVCKDRLVKKKGVPSYFYYDCKKYKLNMEGDDKIDDKQLIAYLIKNIKSGTLKPDRQKSKSKPDVKKKPTEVEAKKHQADVIGKPLKAELTAREKDALSTSYFNSPFKTGIYPPGYQIPESLAKKMTGNKEQDYDALMEQYQKTRKTSQEIDKLKNRQTIGIFYNVMRNKIDEELDKERSVLTDNRLKRFLYRRIKDGDTDIMNVRPDLFDPMSINIKRDIQNMNRYELIDLIRNSNIREKLYYYYDPQGAKIVDMIKNLNIYHDNPNLDAEIRGDYRNYRAYAFTNDRDPDPAKYFMEDFEDKDFYDDDDRSLLSMKKSRYQTRSSLSNASFPSLSSERRTYSHPPEYFGNDDVDDVGGGDFVGDVGTLRRQPSARPPQEYGYMSRYDDWSKYPGYGYVPSPASSQPSYVYSEGTLDREPSFELEETPRQPQEQSWYNHLYDMEVQRKQQQQQQQQQMTQQQKAEIGGSFEQLLMTQAKMRELNQKSKQDKKDVDAMYKQYQRQQADIIGQTESVRKEKIKKDLKLIDEKLNHAYSQMTKLSEEKDADTIQQNLKHYQGLISDLEKEKRILISDQPQQYQQQQIARSDIDLLPQQLQSLGPDSTLTVADYQDQGAAAKTTQTPGYVADTSAFTQPEPEAVPATPATSNEPVFFDDFGKPLEKKGEGSNKNKGGLMLMGLSNSEIDNMMKPLQKHGFIKTVARDQINDMTPVNNSNKIGFVMNTQPIKVKYGHWVAVLIDKEKGTVEYFDPLGDEPDKRWMKDIKKFLKNHNISGLYQCKINRVTRQKTESDTCGYHSMKFLKERMDGKTFKQATGYDDAVELINKANAGEKAVKKFKDQISKFGTVKI
jgi:hypothetical protein